MEKSSGPLSLYNDSDTALDPSQFTPLLLSGWAIEEHRPPIGSGSEAPPLSLPQDDRGGVIPGPAKRISLAQTECYERITTGGRG